ncbi:MAG: hypothetical protein NZ556_06510, partial [Fimbriimonadales bacterium]|nr:hypothetical protein [Fimbriimonadales bacterium]
YKCTGFQRATKSVAWTVVSKHHARTRLSVLQMHGLPACHEKRGLDSCVQAPRTDKAVRATNARASSVPRKAWLGQLCPSTTHGQDCPCYKCTGWKPVLCRGVSISPTISRRLLCQLVL